MIRAQGHRQPRESMVRLELCLDLPGPQKILRDVGYMFLLYLVLVLLFYIKYYLITASPSLTFPHLSFNYSNPIVIITPINPPLPSS